MINIFKKLLDFIYDKKCYFCSQSTENSLFCSKCYSSVEILPLKPINDIDGIKIYSVTYYKDVVQKLIRAVKYHNQKKLADYQALLMYEYWKNIDNTNYTVIPVPMFFEKEKKRKYNHMNLVCEKFCTLSNFELNKNAVIRNRETAPQYNLSKAEREKNLKGAFSIIDKQIKEPVLLMDDISTTGTTLKEIISILKENKITDITAFVTAIPVPVKNSKL